MMLIDKLMKTGPVIPVIVIKDLDTAVPIAKALVAGGLKVLEVTLRTPCALDAIKLIDQQVDGAIVGAGTVVQPQDVDASLAAGAEFLVSPGTTSALIRAAQEQHAPLLPGVATPSEAMALMDQGFNHLKFFPAEAAGGAAMLKSMAGPLPQLKFCPTGGVSLDNATNYLELDNVLCVGGSWMLQSDDIENKDWSSVTRAAQHASNLK